MRSIILIGIAILLLMGAVHAETSDVGTGLSWTNVGSKILTFGETWDMGEGYTLTAQFIDAKATPRQVWFVLSKNGVKLDDRILSEGQIYSWNNIISTKIYRIWAGPVSDYVELTDVYMNKAITPAPTVTASWTIVGSKILTVGETWDVGSGVTLSTASIDAKVAPRQVWLVLSKDALVIG